MVCTGLVALNAVAAEKKAPAMEQQIDALVKSYAKHQLFSGTVLVAKQGKVLYQASIGEANKDHRVPNTLHTNYNIGSMGKTFTAVAIMQLVQQTARFVPLRRCVGFHMARSHLFSLACEGGWGHTCGEPSSRRGASPLPTRTGQR